MLPLQTTTRATTRKVVVSLIQVCVTFKLCPFTIKARTLQFETVQGKWARFAVYLQLVLFTLAYTSYLLVTQVLIWTRHITSGSIVNNSMHFQFLIALTIASGLNLYLVVYGAQLVAAMNQFMRFWKEFEGKPSAHCIFGICANPILFLDAINYSSTPVQSFMR